MLVKPVPARLPWEAHPFAALMRLSWPIAVSTLSYSVMTLAGTLFVGRLGPAALAGVGLGGTAAFATICFAFGLLRGAKVLVSQAVGAGRTHEVGAHLGAALLAAVGLGAIAIAAGEVVARFLGALAATPASGAAAAAYLRIRILSAPAVLAFVALREVRYGIGDARWPMLASVAGNVANIALDWLLLVRLGRGVEAAGWGTVLGHGVELAVLLWPQARAGFGVRAMRARHIAALFRIGAPTGLQFALEVGSFALLAALIAAMSEEEMAAHQIALQVVQFSFLPALAVSEAASVLVGQAVGAGRHELVRGLSRLAMWVAGAYTALCSVVMALGGSWIASGFTSEPRLRLAAAHLLAVAAVFQVFDGANVVARGALRGTGDVHRPAVIGVVTSWLLTPPLAWLLGWRLGLGALGGWIGLCAEIILGAALLWWRLERGGWRPAAAAVQARAL